MHDLNTINRISYEAFAAAITSFRAKGRWVLARYEGAHLVSIETFSEQTHAQYELELKPANALQGQRAEILSPLPAFHAAKRDQSEDKTLGDYIARKAQLLDDNT